MTLLSAAIKGYFPHIDFGMVTNRHAKAALRPVRADVAR